MSLPADPSLLPNPALGTEPVLTTIPPSPIARAPMSFEQAQEETPWTQSWNVVTARMRALSGRIGKRLIKRTLKIGISARIFHPEPGGKGLRGKTLQYLEESIAQWVMSRDVLVFMIPTVNTNGILHPSNIRLRDYAKHLDGLVLQGGGRCVAAELFRTCDTPGVGWRSGP